jgi:hypothetical protein
MIAVAGTAIRVRVSGSGTVKHLGALVTDPVR